jgi:proteasome accessory factor C
MAEVDKEGVRVTPDVMADTFSRPARLSPLMARALLLALDLLGDMLTVPGLESLAPVRRKVMDLVGASSSRTVMLDDVLPPDPRVVEALNRGINERLVVELTYFTPGRMELGRRLVEPYLLFRSQDAWYLEAYCLVAGAQRTFKLERIRSARLTDATFVPRAEMDLASGRAGQALHPADIAAWATVHFTSRWRRHLEDRGLEYVALPGDILQARIPYADEGWMAYEVLRFLGEAVLQRPSSVRTRVRELAALLAARYERGEKNIVPTPAEKETL